MKLRAMTSLLLAALLLAGSTSYAAEGDVYYHYYTNPYTKFSVPAMVTAIGDEFYLTDTYHNQILHSSGVGVTPKDWSVMVNDLSLPHGIAGDGTVFLALDTENSMVKVYVEGKDGYTELKEFEHIGVRPHDIEYVAEEGLFLVWSSMTGEMYYFARREGTTDVYLAETKKIDRLYGMYTRSFTREPEKSEILFPSMDLGAILVADSRTLEIKRTVDVPDALGGMVQIQPVDGGYLLTVSTDADWNHEGATIVFASSLKALSEGHYTDVNAKFGGDGAPYYITEINGVYYTPVLKETKPAELYSFRVEDGRIEDVTEYLY